MVTRSRVASAALALLCAGCGGDPPNADVGVVAWAGGHRWTVADAASLLALKPDLPAQRELLRSMAELWIDYTLLAAAAAQDSTLSQLDLSDLVRELVDEQLVLALRDSVIRVPPMPPEQLRERYRREAPDHLVRARHILLIWPVDATGAQRDSVVRQAEALRQRAVAGEDFAALATAYSQDSASAAEGGRLPIFGKGQMLAPLEEAAFALDPGAVSGPVSTPFGVHLLMVDERPLPSLDRFQTDLLARQAAAAESVYVASLERSAAPKPAWDAFERVRRLARGYRDPLPANEARYALVTYAGGTVTQSEVLWFLQSRAPEARAETAEAAGQVLAQQLLRGVTHQELLVQAARARGWSVPQERQDEVAAAARRNLAEAARLMGLLPLTVAVDERPEEAVDRAVDALLSGILTGDVREVAPLGPMSYVLRTGTPSRVVDAGLDTVVRDVARARGNTGGT